jgi:hypothetical protein
MSLGCRRESTFLCRSLYVAREGASSDQVCLCFFSVQFTHDHAYVQTMAQAGPLANDMRNLMADAAWNASEQGRQV